MTNYIYATCMVCGNSYKFTEDEFTKLSLKVVGNENKNGLYDMEIAQHIKRTSGCCNAPHYIIGK